MKISNFFVFGILFLAFFFSFCASAEKPTFKINRFSSQSSADSIFWIDRDAAFTITSSPDPAFIKLFHSTDEGNTWQDQTTLLSSHSEANYPVWLYAQNNFTNNLFLMGNEGSWYSNDKGETWNAIARKVTSFLWHPTKEGWALANSLGEVWMTKDGGKNWQSLKKISSKFSWGDAGKGHVPSNRVYYLDRSKKELQFSDDEGKSWKTERRDCFDFLFRQHHILVIIVDQEHASIDLYVTSDIGRFEKFYVQSEFPFGKELDYNSYTILDDESGSIFMGVSHSAHWGNLYYSNAGGWRYSLSLPHMSVSPYYDFERVKSLEGVFLANTVENWDSDPSGSKKNDIIQTYFSFNNGGEWFPLKHPAVDSKGKPIRCSGNCHLHLHGWNGLPYYFGPFYSSANAIGLLVATGNVGEQLSFIPDEINTYLSRDAGQTWAEVKKGSTIYEMGDHGAIIVFADYGKPTNKVYYTLDQGLTPLQEIELPITVDVINIVTEPTATGERFILIGRENGQSLFILLDFSRVHNRNCDESDYEDWSPDDGREDLGGRKCLLGRTTVYKRRKPTAQCFNTKEFTQVVKITNCPCEIDDYECDYGYKPVSLQNNTCVLIGDPPKYPPENCPSGSSYQKTQGYRKIAGDTCEGGLDLNPKGHYKCPGSSSNKGWIAAVVIIPLVLLLLVAGIFALRSERIREKLPFLKGLNSWKVGYLGMQNAPDSLEEEGFTLRNSFSEDEFHQSPRTLSSHSDIEKLEKEDEEKEDEEQDEEEEKEEQKEEEDEEEFNPRQ